MLLIAYGYTELAIGVILIATAAITIKKIHDGSKAIFAYTLLTFTFLDGI